MVNENGEPVAPEERGLLVIRKPWPGMLPGIFGNPERYKEAYWSKFTGVFYTGDYAIKNKDGYFWLLGRANEVLMVAGHRMGTAELEDTVASHPQVAEATLVGKADPIKDESIVVFVILKEGNTPAVSLKKKLADHMRRMVEPIAAPDEIYFVSKLPKTRSGKIMRRILKPVANDATIGNLTTLEDKASIEEIVKAYQKLKKAEETK